MAEREHSEPEPAIQVDYGLGCRSSGLRESGRKPRVAAARGYCSGGGNELAFACDFVIAADDTRCALPEIDPGVVSALAVCRQLETFERREMASPVHVGPVDHVEIALHKAARTHGEN